MVVGWLVATRSHFAHFWGPLENASQNMGLLVYPTPLQYQWEKPCTEQSGFQKQNKNPNLVKQYVVETWGGVPVRITMFIEVEYPNLWELKSVLYKLYNNIHIYIYMCDPCMISTAPQVPVFLLEANPGFSNPN